jgi:hypothetical protein
MFATCLEQELIDRVVASPAVQELSGNPRFDQFIHPDTTHEEWISTMGADFDNRNHMFLTAYLCQAITEAEHATPEDTYATVLTGIVHDAAESIGGDKCIHLKEEGDDEKEIDQIGKLVAEKALLLTPIELETVSRVMLDKHNGAKTAPGKLFDLAEIAGYLLSAHNAWHTAKAPHISDGQRTLMRFLTINVLGGQVAAVLPYHEQGFVTPGLILRGMSSTILQSAEQVTAEELEAHARHCEAKKFGHKAPSLNAGFLVVKSQLEQLARNNTIAA